MTNITISLAYNSHSGFSLNNHPINDLMADLDAVLIRHLEPANLLTTAPVIGVLATMLAMQAVDNFPDDPEAAKDFGQVLAGDFTNVLMAGVVALSSPDGSAAFPTLQ